ncbi:HEAT repeat domain-containing protein [uncultured Zobellia sp.]|uniref:HEAT repeat domain-containing protein n=1 Tax=uncultured Zobellia sp. TaxID=255433 RepID=UPI002595E88F|nr:HEAT repeat domain-containing protein [uncultured Zobellia sp.]
MLETYKTYHGAAFITPPKVDTDILWGLSILFVVLAVVYFICVFFFRNKISATASRTKQRKKELSPMISEFLFYEADADKGEKSNYISLKIEIRELLKDDFNRKVLVEVLLDLRKDVSGDTQERLFALYQDLGLEKDAFEKLKSWRWEVISKGILELTQMQVESAYSFITKFINHKKGTIRKQAEIATVTLRPEGINYFLDTTRYKISEWQQLKLLDVLRNRENYDPPRFRTWLTSKNKHVVLFALRLIKYYNQNDANASLIELVKHKDYQIREEAIGCIKEFYVVESIPALKAIFRKCNTDSKIAVLGAISELGSANDIDFLKSVAKKESNFSVSSKALAAINMIAPETVMPTEGLEKPKPYKEYIAEVELINETTTEAASPLVTPVQSEEEVDHMVEDLPFPDTSFDQSSQESEENTVENSPVEEIADSELRVSIDVESVETEGFVNNDSTTSITESPEEKEVKEEVKELVEKVELTELLVIDPIIVTGFVSKTIESQAEIFSEPSLRFDFLPIVIADSIPTNQPTTKYRPMANTDNHSPDINNIEVEYVVVSSTLQKRANTGKPFFDIANIDFLPIVVEDMDLEDLESTIIDEVNELDFLPIVLDNDVEIEEEVHDETTEELVSRSSTSLDGFTLSDFEVDFANAQEVTTSEGDITPDKTLQTDLEGPKAAELENEDVLSWLMAENELREIELEYETVNSNETTKPFLDLIPEPVYYDEHETYMMGLLDDLEEMGDHREVPLLKELLAEETRGFIKDRINSLIEQFSSFGNMINKIGDRAPEEPTLDMPAFSVFADLFKNIGTESKLILLDEIVSVGDEKEIDFLDGLLEDPDLRIRKKAQSALKLLVEKVSRKSDFEKDLLPKPVEELPIDLSILEPFTQSKPNKTDTTIKSAVNTQDNQEIIKFDFELEDTRVLDKKYDKKTLSIEVDAIEVSPNESSFFTSIIDFPRKFIGKLNG